MSSEDYELEIELLRRIAGGDRASFEQFYERLSGILFATAFRILHDQPSAEDVLQEVFVQIWQRAGQYDPSRGKPLTWAVTLTRNKAIDRVRAGQRRLRLREDFEREQNAPDNAASENDPSGGVEASERGQMVRRAVRQLSPEQRRAIELAFFSGLTQVEIAAHLQEPLGTVKARIRRGMMKLRDLIAPHL